jgi:hypothetical protein
MLWGLLTVSVVAALLGFSYRRLVEVRRLATWAAPYLARPLGRAHSPTGTSSRELEGTRETIADLNEATIELGFRLGEPGFVPRACAKAALFVGAMLALIQGARLLSGADEKAWSGPLLSLVVGCAGALGCALIGRAAEAEARRLRDDWRTLIRRSTQDVPT